MASEKKNLFIYFLKEAGSLSPITNDGLLQTLMELPWGSGEKMWGSLYALVG